jgi:hypothetical protein
MVLGSVVACAMIAALVGGPLWAGPEQTSGKLTDQSLGNLLQAMGLETKLEEKRYDFHFKALFGEEEWDLTMSAVLSQNGESVWVMAWLDELPKSAADVPRTALLRLLSDNDRMGNGKFFAYIAGNRRFVLQRVVPNQNMTTAGFRAILQDLGASVAETYTHWSIENWKAQPSQAQTESDKSDEKTRRAPASSSGKVNIPRLGAKP